MMVDTLVASDGGMVVYSDRAQERLPLTFVDSAKTGTRCCRCERFGGRRQHQHFDALAWY